MAPPAQYHRDWHREHFTVSTRPSLLDHGAINDALNSELIWWTNSVPLDQLATMLDNSLCFGLYDNGTSEGQDMNVALKACSRQADS